MEAVLNTTTPTEVLSTSLAEVPTTTEVSSTTTEPSGEIDGFFIGSLVCIGVGLILLIIGFARLAVWVHQSRTQKQLGAKKRRHLEHMRHLERYSLRAGDSPNDVIVRPVTPNDNDSVFVWDSSLVNAGYIGQDTLERHSPVPPKLNAHINGSSVAYSRQGSRPVSVASQQAVRPGSVASHPGTRPANQSNMQQIRLSSGSDSGIQNGGFVQDPDENDNEVGKTDRLADVPM